MDSVTPLNKSIINFTFFSYASLCALSNAPKDSTKETRYCLKLPKFVAPKILFLISSNPLGVLALSFFEFSKIEKTVLRAVDTAETTSIPLTDALLAPLSLSSFKELDILSKIGFDPP